MKIILFEDSQDRHDPLLVAINAALGNKGHAYLFTPSLEGNAEGTYEQLLAKDLAKAGHEGASLIVADSDLSKLKPYGGLSEPTVRVVADKLGIPECSYARGEKASSEFLADAERHENRIAVSLPEMNEHFARDVVSIADGFASILDQVPAALKTSGRKSPGRLLGTILGKPEYSEKIALYASGDRNRFGSWPLDGKDAHRRLACLLGYWLWDSVLRFPGVVVNKVAAGSYLNIKDGAFEGKVQKVFEAALYAGPFSGARGPLWWRGMLDDMVATSGGADGREFAERQLGEQIPASECCEDRTTKAGYYCMLSGKPVSLEKSKDGLSWFPRGADLARISLSKYEEIVPWL